MAYLLTGWDTARIGGLSVAVSDAYNSGTVTIPAGTYAHRGLSPAMGSGRYVEFAPVLQTRIRTVLVAALANAAWDPVTGRYTLSSVGNASPVFDFRTSAAGPGGPRLAKALGFTYLHPFASGGSAAAPYDVRLSGHSTSYVGDADPAYYLGLAKAGPSDYSRDHETSGQTVRQVSSNATTYSVGPLTRERRTKFKLRFQALETVFEHARAHPVLWTYESLVMHARCVEPVLLGYSAEDLVVKLVNGDFDEAARSSVWRDYHGHWDLSVEAQVIGRL